MLELPPIVFAEAEHDEVAAGIVERVAAEIVDLARAALTRLELQDDRVEVALAGGLIRNMDGRVLDLILEELRAVAPKVELRPTASPPVIGAALYGLDQIGADAAAHDRVREQLAASPTNGSDERWLTFASRRPRASTRARTRPPSMRSTCTSPTASSSSSSAPPDRARRPLCACSPASRRSTPARS